MLSSEQLKQAAARAAIDMIQGEEFIGVGTGSTANAFIDLLPTLAGTLRGAVASSEQTATRLRGIGVEVMDLNMTGTLPVYIDGADEANSELQLIKGGGGALTREKVVAAASERFICIVDHSKKVTQLGAFPLPVEVIPMARSYVARSLVALGGDPELRDGIRTDNNNFILDVHNLTIENPAELENTINQIAGVVTVGLFAARPADTLLIAEADGTISSIGTD